MPGEFSDRSAVAEWLTSKKGSKVEIKVPMKGSKRRLVDLVGRYAKLAYELDHREEESGTSIRLDSLQSVLNLAECPERIEGFDVSNFQGRETVASMVVFELGQPKRSDYRKYKIKSLPSNQIDDFASIREVVYRRYRRVLEEGSQLPDLIVVDGGKGQIGSALQALEELGLSYLPLIALAKKEELIFLPERTDPIKLDQYSPARQLLQHVRDEAHRFAVSFHRKLRKARDFSSPLEAIYGVGPRKRQKLLTQFGSIKGVRSATLEQLKNSLGAKLGQRVYLHIAEKL